MSDKELDLRNLQKPYKRKTGAYEVLPMTGGDIADLLTLAVDTARKRGVAKYENTPEGLQAFTERSLQYLEFINEQNKQADETDARRLIPSIESWAVYMGLSRMTLLTYEKQRNADWSDFISWQKNVIMSARTQLADLSKIAPLMHIFTAVNSHSGYANTSEIKLTAIPEREEKTTHESASAIAERYRGKLTDAGQDIAVDLSRYSSNTGGGVPVNVLNDD